MDATTYLTALECAACGRHFAADRLWNLCPDCGRPLLARYDLAAARRGRLRAAGAARPQHVWRFAELLPVADPAYRLTLGEGGTPLLPAPRLGADLGLPRLWIKDEGCNPTGSFKARGMAVAVARARELGARELSLPSAGNAAGAAAAYGALAGLAVHVFMPRDVSAPFVAECRTLGASVTLVDGVITDCARAAARAGGQVRFDLATLKEPYRLEGKKTMGYELAEQLGWRLPDVIVYPTGGGTGLIGMWKAFDELEQLGWIGAARPRMVVVQAAGCAPIVRAWTEGTPHAEVWADAATVAEGLRVPAAVGDFLILQAVRESQGTAVAVTDEEILAAGGRLGRLTGIFAAPEGAATVAGAAQLRRTGWLTGEEEIVLFNTGSGHKYAHLYLRPPPGAP